MEVADIPNMKDETEERRCNAELQKRVAELENATAERKRAVEELRQSKEKYRFLAEKMVDIVWILDLDFQTTYVSPSIKSVLGFTPEERKLQTIEEMITPESFHRVQEMFLEELQREEKHIADPDRSGTIEVEYYHKNGSSIWMENIVKVQRTPAGAAVGIYGVSRDITEHKKAEKELQKRINELETFYRTTLGREGRVIELKKEVNGLLEQLGKKKKYGDNT
jgi:PAS domain S-box-containing protein